MSDLEKVNRQIKDRLKLRYELYTKFEQDFILEGCTAIEDLLQDHVPETIKVYQQFKSYVKFIMLFIMAY